MSIQKIFPAVITSVVFLGLAHGLHLLSTDLIKKDFVASRAYAKSLIPDADSVHYCALGFERIVADVYWLMFVQYYGDRAACLQDKFSQAPAYLNLITHLDPHFIQPFWFASFVMASELGLRRETEGLLNYGIAQNLPADIRAADLRKMNTNPDSQQWKIAEIMEKTNAKPYWTKDTWNLEYIAGFNQFIYEKNEQLAAQYYRLGTKVDGCPEWLERQADVFSEGLRSRTRAIQLGWAKILNESKDPLVRDKAQQMLLILWSRVFWAAYDLPPQTRTPWMDRAAHELRQLGFPGPMKKEALPAATSDESADELLKLLKPETKK